MAMTDLTYFIQYILEIEENKALILANVLIGTEFYIFCNLLIYSNRKLTYKILFYFLIFMNIFLVSLYVLNNVENCFCFGLFLEMTPLQSIFKNIILMIISYILYLNCSELSNFKINDFVSFFLIVLLINVFLKEPKDFFIKNLVTTVEQNDLKLVSKYIIIDVRNENSFKIKNIKGSINFAYGNNLDVNLDKKIELLIERKYSFVDVTYLKEGIEKWKD